MRELPRGTVTFLFTDIEGSTRLLHELGDAYADVLAEHRRVLRDAFAAHGGVEVDTQGDAFFVAFERPADAVACAELAQHVLGHGPVRVRMGIHTGEPTVTGEGYVGEDVHLGARIAAAGHGGQVLLSSATRELVDGDLLDLGEHRLKDFTEPAGIFQLGSDRFPPLKTISNTNLPRPASSFVGREREVADIVALLRADARMVTLTGPGGSGKTRLAIEAAFELVPDFKSGVFWVGLAALRDSTLVTGTIAGTLGIHEGLAQHVGERELLLLLDNLEQVIEAAPELAALLESCPGLRLLVTSRELLRVRGEVEYSVPPLAQREAVELFAVRSGVEPDEAVGALCVRLDNLPLAVELAAARAKALSPAQILDRLSQRLDLLKGGRDADPRQQTLRATIEWSHDLLSPGEQELFRRLSVFRGGCTLEAVEDVAGSDVDTLQSLVEKSLLRFTNQRYWMLETIRDFAAERLEECGERDASKRRHANFVLMLASQLETDAGTDGVPRDRFAAEQDNFRAALAWAEEAGETALQLDLIGRSWPFWWFRGHSGEGLRWVESALERSDAEESERRAKALAAGAMFAYRHGELDTLERYADESLRIARGLTDPRATIWPLILRAIWASESGESGEATKLYEEAIAVAGETGERRLVGIAHNNLGVIALKQGDLARASALFEEAVAIARERGTPDEVAQETINLAECLLRAGRMGEAAKAAKDGLALGDAVGSLTSLGMGFVVLGALACRQGSAAAAARLLGAAEALRDRARENIADEAELLDATVAELVSALGREAYSAALAEGKAMPLDQAVEHALALD